MPIYLERGFKNNKIEVLQNTASSFEWLSVYKPKIIDKKPTETNEEYLKRLEELKPKQQYFISGYIEPDEKGRVKRNNESLVRRDLIIIDYDALNCSSKTFKKRIVDRLPNTNIIIYPTIRFKDEKPRFRVVIEPSRPLLKYEYLEMLKEITHKIDLPYDTASETWSQCQGLPVLTEWNKNEGLTVYRGDHYEVPNNIEPPIQRKPFKNTLNADTVGKFSHSKAIEIFKEYLEHEEANLYKYNCTRRRNRIYYRPRM